jgi:hypothetical protein
MRAEKGREGKRHKIRPQKGRGNRRAADASKHRGGGPCHWNRPQHASSLDEGARVPDRLPRGAPCCLRAGHRPPPAGHGGRRFHTAEDHGGYQYAAIDPGAAADSILDAKQAIEIENIDVRVAASGMPCSSGISAIAPWLQLTANPRRLRPCWA